MKENLLRAERFFLTFYLVSITCSIAGMEIFSALIALNVALTITLRKKFNYEIPSWRTPIDIPILGFWIWIGICLFIIPEVKPEHRLDVWASLRWIGLFYFVRIAIIRQFDYLKSISKYLLGWVLFVSIYGVIQFQTGWDPIHTDGFGFAEGFWRTRGFFSSVMSFSYVFGMIYFFVVARTLLAPKVFSQANLWPLLTTFFLTWALAGTYTRGLWIGMTVGLLSVFFVFNRRWVAGLLVALSIVGATAYLLSDNMQTRVASFFDFSPKNESNYDRINLWLANIEIFKSNPITGVGFRQNASHVSETYNKLGIESDFYSHAHNNYLSVLAGTGLIGFAFYIWFSLVTLISSLQTQNFAPQKFVYLKTLFLGAFGSLICFHVGGLTESNIYDGETTHALLTIMALIFSATHLSTNKESTTI